MTYNTDYYISEISKMSDRFGDKLLELMEKYNKPNLASISFEEAKAFYEELVEKENEE